MGFFFRGPFKESFKGSAFFLPGSHLRVPFSGPFNFEALHVGLLLGRVVWTFRGLGAIGFKGFGISGLRV